MYCDKFRPIRFIACLMLCSSFNCIAAAQELSGESSTQTPAIVVGTIDSAPQRQSQPLLDELGDPLPEGALLRLGTVRFRHPSNVVDIALSPDDKTIVSVGRELIAWDTETGKEKWRAGAIAHGINLPGAAYGVRPLVFSTDGEHLWTVGRGSRLNRWDVKTGRVESIAVGAGDGADRRPNVLQGRAIARPADRGSQSIDVSPDGEKLAVGDSGGVVVMNLQGETLYAIENRPEKPVEVDAMNNDRLLFGGDYASGQFSPDGTLLAVVRSQSPEEVLLVDAASGKEIRSIALTARLVRLAFSPDGKRLAATERNNSVRAYEVATGKELWSHTFPLKNQFENYTSAIVFNPAGDLVAAACTDNIIYLFNAEEGQLAGRLTGHTWYPWALAFASDGATLFSSGWDGPIRRWDMATLKQRSLPVGVRATGMVAVSPDETLLVYADDAGTVRLVNAESGKEQQRFAFPESHASQAAFSADGSQLAIGGETGDKVFVAVHELPSSKLLHRWEWPKGRDSHSSVEAIAFSPDGERLAAAVFRQSQILLWNLRTAEEVARLVHDEVYGMAFRPDGSELVTVGWDAKIRGWSPQDGALTQTIDVAERVKADGDFRMYAVSFAPVGNALATAHMNGEVWVWNANDMTRRRRFGLRGNFSYGALSFSPDGLWIATGISSGRVSLWDAYSGEEAWSRSHQDHIYNVAFRKGSSQVVSGGDDGVCYLWQVNSQGPPLAEFDGEQLWQEFAGDSGKIACQAMAHLVAHPQEAIPLLRDKIGDVESLLDPTETEEATIQQTVRTRQLKALLIDKDPRIERRAAYHRAVAVLSQIGTPAAIEILDGLANANRGEASELAAHFRNIAVDSN